MNHHEGMGRLHPHIGRLLPQGLSRSNVSTASSSLWDSYDGMLYRSFFLSQSPIFPSLTSNV